jgi:hypothetical protein
MSVHKRQFSTATHLHEGEPADADHGLPHDELPFVTSIHPSPIEVLILDVARCFCFGWANGDIAAWDYAFELCEERFGPVEGPAFVARVISLMRTLLKERRCGLSYMPVRCSRLCPDEERLMRAVQSAIRGDADTLRIAVAKLTLTKRPETTRTLTAAQVLSVFCHHYDLMAEPDGAQTERRILN